MYLLCEACNIFRCVHSGDEQGDALVKESLGGSWEVGFKVDGNGGNLQDVLLLHGECRQHCLCLELLLMTFPINFSVFVVNES